MKKEYDFFKMRNKRNPYAKRLKKQVTKTYKKPVKDKEKMNG